MGTGYTRNDTANNIADGNVINAADFDGEYDAIEAAFNSSTGHTHDGTAAEGGPITVLGPNQEFVASASAVAPSTNAGIDIGTLSLKFKDLFIDGTAYIDGLGGNLLVDTTNAIQFRDTALSISSSADGQLDIAADATAKITSPEVIVTDDFRLQSDAAILTFGADDDVSVTHVADTGLDAQAASGFTLRLQTGDTTVESGNTIGKISFNAPDEASGTDAILVGAEIEAAAEDTFSSTVNSTALVFKTNTSAAATERMRIKSDGDIVLKGASYDFVFDASAHALTTSASNGDLNLTPHGTGTVVVTGDLDVDNINIDGNTISSTDTNGDINITPNGTGTVNITGGIMQDEVNLTSTDAGTSAGPTMDVYRNSSSPVDNDLLGNITFTGNDDAANKTTYASIDSSIIDASNGTEDGQLQLKTMVAGSDTTTLIVSGGNVGVKTTPVNHNAGASTLHVDGGSNAAELRLTNSTTGTAGANGFHIATVGNKSYIVQNEADDLYIYNDGGEMLRFNSSDQAIFGASAERQVMINATVNTNATDATLILQGNTQSSTHGKLFIASSTDSPSTNLGLGFVGFGDVNKIPTAFIGVYNDATWSTGTDMPTRMSFHTTTDGLASATERLRIDSSGNVSLRGLSNGRLNFAGGNTSGGSKIQAFNDAGNANGYLAIEGYSSEYMRIDSSGRLLIGATGSQNVLLSSGNALQIQGLTSNTSGMSTTRHSADGGGPYLNFGKTRGTADSAVTIVQDLDVLGQIFWSGADGTDIQSPAAAIQGLVDGTPSVNDMPGRITFRTTPDGTNATVERMRIDNAGRVSIGGVDPSTFNSNGNQLVISGTSNTGLTIDATSTTESNIFFADGPNGTEAYRGIIRYDHSDDEFRFLTAGGSHAMTIDSSQRVLVGVETAYDNIQSLAEGSNTPVRLQIGTAGSGESAAAFINNHNSAGGYGGNLTLGRELSTGGVLSNGMQTGAIHFNGHDGTNIVQSAAIQAYVDGAPSGGDMPGRLVFYTALDGTDTLSERMRIDDTGNLVVGTGGYPHVDKGVAYGVGSQRYGAAIFKNDNGVASGGSLSLTVRADTGGWAGILTVTAHLDGGANNYKHRIFAVSGRNTSCTFTEIGSGSAGSAPTITMSCPSAGEMRATFTTTGATVSCSMNFNGCWGF